MIELTAPILIIVVALILAFSMSLMLNLIMMPLMVMVAWLLYNSRVEITALREEVNSNAMYSPYIRSIDQILEGFVSLGELLTEVNEMPVYAEEPVIVELIEAIDGTLREVESLLIDRDLLQFIEEREKNGT